MTSTSLFLVAVLCSTMTVHGQNSTGLSFRGPGYLACDLLEYEAMQCNITADFENCTVAQIVDECNATGTVNDMGTFNEDFTIAYIPLVCDCIIALDCPPSCEQFSGDVPTLPPLAFTANFSGVGTVTCPALDYARASIEGEDFCYPLVVDNSTCGTCDAEGIIESLDDDFMIGDETFTIPLPCKCIEALNCPDTCTFTATDGAPTTEETPAAAPAGTPAAPTTEQTAAPAAPTTEETPAAAPVSNATAPAAAPVRSPTAPAAAPVRSPTAAAPSTSAAFATTIHTYKCFAVMTVFALVSIVML